MTVFPESSFLWEPKGPAISLTIARRCILSALMNSGSAIIIASSCYQSTLLKSGSAIIIACSCIQCTLLKCESAFIIALLKKKRNRNYYPL